MISSASFGSRRSALFCMAQTLRALPITIDSGVMVCNFHTICKAPWRNIIAENRFTAFRTVRRAPYAGRCGKGFRCVPHLRHMFFDRLNNKAVETMALCLRKFLDLRLLPFMNFQRNIFKMFSVIFITSFFLGFTDRHTITSDQHYTFSQYHNVLLF